MHQMPSFTVKISKFPWGRPPKPPPVRGDTPLALSLCALPRALRWLRHHYALFSFFQIFCNHACGDGNVIYLCISQVEWFQTLLHMYICMFYKCCGCLGCKFKSTPTCLDIFIAKLQRETLYRLY